MNYAVIFAGGLGSRMKSRSTPKQFLQINGKPILVHTLEVFEHHPQINGIVIACNIAWLDFCVEMVAKFRINKALHIVKGGATGQLSIYNGLKIIENMDRKSIALIHDGVRPLVDAETISRNIASVKKHGSAITCVPTKETVILLDDKKGIGDAVNRNITWIAKAPQSFFLHDILAVHERAMRDGVKDAIDSCTLMHQYGKKLALVTGTHENIKVTTPEDFYVLRALLQARENAQILGF